MNRHLNQAWARLIVMLVVAMVFAYALFWGLAAAGLINPESALKAASVGVRNVSLPLVHAGAERGIDPSIVIFGVNSVAAAVMAMLLFAAPLIDPNVKSGFPRLVRGLLTKEDPIDRAMFRLLRAAPSFRAVGVKELRPLYVWLRLIPPCVMVALGFEIGTIWAAAAEILQSFRVSTATLMPHGLFEIPALALAGALPYGAYRAVRGDMEAGRSAEVFAAIRRAIRSRAVWGRVAGVVVLLIVAAWVEIHVTPLVARWAAG